MPLAEPNPPGAYCCVDIALGGRRTQADVAMIIAAAMLIPMLCRIVVINSRYVAVHSLDPPIYIISRQTYQACVLRRFPAISSEGKRGHSRPLGAWRELFLWSLWFVWSISFREQDRQDRPSHRIDCIRHGAWPSEATTTPPL